ncbi:hypothetical protein [Aeromicrobium sp.]|uniref:hypothetical protein n=1 Tax=Aeromicrobium sp. TaxID=1871063 RepID=UPI003C41B448
MLLLKDHGRTMRDHHDGATIEPGMWIMMLFGLLLLVLVGLAILWTVKNSMAHPTAAPGAVTQHGGSAREVLDLRLARGEVDAQEYESLRALLDR